MTDQPSTRSGVRLLSRHLDVVIVAVCLVAGAAVGSTNFREVFASGGTPWFYQVDFGPAVMWTCGKGFVVPDESGLPRLAEFLQGRSDRFSCADLPADPPERSVEGAQPWLAWSNLIRAAALVWSIAGISWSGLAPLAGLFFGATIALAFVVLRLVAGRVLSAAGAVFVLTSPLYLIGLPQLRDYSKVPFMLALAWILAQLVSPALTSRRMLVSATAYGAILGIGIGFRNDPLITIPPFVGLLLLARSSSQGWYWRGKAVALGLAGLVFLVAASPVLRVYANGGGASMPHAALLGMMSPVDSALSITNGGLYEVGYGLEDSYAAALISGHASRRAGSPQAIGGHTREYDAASASYVRAIAAALPADMLARGFAAIEKVLTLPSSLVETQVPAYVGSPALVRFYSWRSRIVRPLSAIWAPALIVALVLISLRNLRLAIILGVLCVYFTAYPAIQFNVRHVLHLALIPIAGLLFTIEAILARAWRGSPRNALVFIAAAVLLLWVPLAVARSYQHRRLTELMQSYLSAPADPVTVTQRPLLDGRTALDFVPAESESVVRAIPNSVATDYLIAEFAAGACDALAASVTVRYETSHAFADFTHRVSVAVPSTAGQTAYVMLATFTYRAPVNMAGGAISYRPKGLEMPEEQVPCMSRLTRLRKPAQFPLLLNARLPADWQRLPLYLTLSDWESRPWPPDPIVYTQPADLHVSRRVDAAAMELIRAADVDELADTVSVQGDGRLTVAGAGGLGGPGPFTYLVRFKERDLAQGQRLVAEGSLERGGLSIGLIKDGQWTAQVTVTEAGPFMVVVEAPSDGRHSLVIANHTKGSSHRNRFDLQRLAWVRPLMR